MTTLTLDLAMDRPTRRRDAAACRDLAARRDAVAPPSSPDRGGLTLDELLVGVWEGLGAGHPATCPLCSGAMRPRLGSGPRPVGGRCGDCGTSLG